MPSKRTHKKVHRMPRTQHGAFYTKETPSRFSIGKRFQKYAKSRKKKIHSKPERENKHIVEQRRFEYIRRKAASINVRPSRVRVIATKGNNYYEQDFLNRPAAETAAQTLRNEGYRTTIGVPAYKTNI